MSRAVQFEVPLAEIDERLAEACARIAELTRERDELRQNWNTLLSTLKEMDGEDDGSRTVIPALQARSAGLERERDALRERLAEAETALRLRFDLRDGPIQAYFAKHGA